MPRSIKNHSIWTEYQKTEDTFTGEQFYATLTKQFGREEPKKGRVVFKGRTREAVVVKDNNKLKKWGKFLVV